MGDAEESIGLVGTCELLPSSRSEIVVGAVVGLSLLSAFADGGTAVGLGTGGATGVTGGETGATGVAGGATGAAGGFTTTGGLTATGATTGGPPFDLDCAT